MPVYQHQTQRRVSVDAVWPLKRADGSPWHAAPRPASRPRDVFQPLADYEQGNRMAWPFVLAVPVVIVGLALWALPAEAGPRWSGSTPSQQAVSAADAATITNARGR